MSPKRKRVVDTHGALLCGIVAGERGLGAHFKEVEREHVAKRTREIYERQPPLWYPQMHWKDLPFENDTGPAVHDASHRMEGIEYLRSTSDGKEDFKDGHMRKINDFATALTTGTTPSLESVEAMENIMLRGIERAVGLVKNVILIQGYLKPSFFPVGKKGLRLPPEFEMTDMVISGSMPFQEEYNTRLFGRRFWGAKFQFCPRDTSDKLVAKDFLSSPQKQHWATALFDRRSSTFIYFDTKNQQRGTRAKAAALAWRAYLANFQLPYGFYLFSPSLTEQPSDYDSPYLSFFVLYQAVRTHVGQGLNDLFDSSSKKFKVLFDSNCTKQRPSLKCDIRLRDWGALGDSPSKAFTAVAHILTAICLHELGDLCRRPDQNCKWLQTIKINRYRKPIALDTLADSIDFGGPVCANLPDGRAHARGHPAKRLFQRRATPQAGWYILPPLPPFISNPPVTDTISDETIESLWKERNEGNVPPDIRVMQQEQRIEPGGSSGVQVAPTDNDNEQGVAFLTARLDSPDVLCGSTVLVTDLDNPPWCPPRGDMPEWRSIWSGLASACQQKWPKLIDLRYEGSLVSGKT